MLIYPAIDLRGGQVVRLKTGDYAQETVYGRDPAQVALGFRAAGADHIHLVDLDGARDGAQQNFAAVQKIASQGGWFVEMGGGARDEAAVERMLQAGVNRVILGTMAIERPQAMEKLAARYPGRIAAGVDARDGRVAIHGWRTLTDVDALQFVKSLPQRGVNCVIYTDIARDGMLEGPNFSAYQALANIPDLLVIASGGVTSLEDVERLAQLHLHGAIIGKALYDGRIDLARAIAAGRGESPCC